MTADGLEININFSITYNHTGCEKNNVILITMNILYLCVHSTNLGIPVCYQVYFSSQINFSNIFSIILIDYISLYQHEILIFKSIRRVPLLSIAFVQTFYFSIAVCNERVSHQESHLNHIKDIVLVLRL